MGGLAQYKGVIAAGKRHTFNVRGSFISLYSITGAVVAQIQHRQTEVGDKSGEAYTLELRKYEKWFVTGEYDAVTVINDGDTQISVTLLLGYGDFVREVTSRSEVPENWFLGPQAELANNGATYTEICAANNLRSRIIIRNKDSGAGSDLRLQHTEGAEGAFVSLAEGDQYEFHHKGAIYARGLNGAGGTFDWDAMEEFFDA
jgi:hypothetical protein